MIYKPTVKELEIFCGYTTEEFSEPYEVLEHASRIAKVDAGFVGMGPDKYVIDDKSIYTFGEDDYAEVAILENGIYKHKINYFDGLYLNDECQIGIYKAYMFRLVLLWMKQQEEKNNV